MPQTHDGPTSFSRNILNFSSYSTHPIMTHALRGSLFEMCIGRKVPLLGIFKLTQADIFIYRQHGQHVKRIQTASEMQGGQPSVSQKKRKLGAQPQGLLHFLCSVLHLKVNCGQFQCKCVVNPVSLKPFCHLGVPVRKSFGVLNAGDLCSELY